jgi:hypothetical protein
MDRVETAEVVEIDMHYTQLHLYRSSAASRIADPLRTFQYDGCGLPYPSSEAKGCEMAITSWRSTTV